MAVAVYNPMVPDTSVHRGRCDRCQWLCEKRSWRAALRATAAHIEETGHASATVVTHRTAQVMAAPDITKFREQRILGVAALNQKRPGG